MNKDAQYLYNNCVLCDEHFEDVMFMNKTTKHSLVWYKNYTFLPSSTQTGYIAKLNLSILCFCNASVSKTKTYWFDI